MRLHVRASASMASLMSLAVQAQSTQPSIAGTGGSGSWLGGAWLGLVTLTMIVVLVAIVLWLYRRGTQGPSSVGSIQILATYPLGPRERLLVVRVQDRILTLGQTPSQISMLTELESFDVPVPSANIKGQFAAQLQSLIQGRRGT